MIQFVTYADRYAIDFDRLNRAWLVGHGLLEAADEEQMLAPRAAIIDRGGQIFFAIQNGQAVGTSAILPVGDGMVELAKLAVDPSAQEKGIGRKLTVMALAHAKSLGARKVILVSNSKLTHAI